MRTVLVLAGVVGMLAAPWGFAQSGAEVVKAKGCLNCHDADTKKVGPAYKDVAAKYKGDKGAADKLVAKLKDGQGHMKITATDAELKAAVAYALAGGK